MMKSTRNLKVLARFVDVTMIMVLVVCGFIIIKSHIDIAKGYIGQQEVTAVRIFDNLFVIDENNNRRYWQNVKNFLFAEDALIIEAVDPEDASNITIRLHRREMSLKTFSGKPMQVVYDFFWIDTWVWQWKEENIWWCQIGRSWQKPTNIVYSIL